jgi:hypothetical protein
MECVRQSATSPPSSRGLWVACVCPPRCSTSALATLVMPNNAALGVFGFTMISTVASAVGEVEVVNALTAPSRSASRSVSPTRSVSPSPSVSLGRCVRGVRWSVYIRYSPLRCLGSACLPVTVRAGGALGLC